MRRTRKRVQEILDQKQTPVIKLCGLMKPEDFKAAQSADLIGCVFTKSSRRIDPIYAHDCLKNITKDVLSCGVFRNENFDEIVKAADTSGVDIIQLHGSEPDDWIEKLKDLGYFVIRAFGISDVKGEDLLAEIEASPADLVLLDAKKPGSGKSFNWDLIHPKRRFLLAGGLSKENIKEAERLNSFGFDLSSGIETNGKKDKDKIREILKIGRELKKGRCSR